jgi:hypothetical protein
MQVSPALRSAAAAPYLAPAPFALAAAIANRLSAAAAASVVASAAAAAVARLAWERVVSGRRRWQVDEWLARGVGQPPPDALIRERMVQLVSEPERHSAARSLRAVCDHGRRPPALTAVVVNARAAARNRAALERLAARLDAVERPVAARGVARTVQLLSDGTGPVYNPGRADELGPALEHALHELEAGHVPLATAPRGRH